MNQIPEMSQFVYEDFYSLGIKDGKYIGIKRKGLKDFERGIIYEDDEFLILSEEKWTAFDMATGVEICKERDFDRLYQKVTDMRDEIEIKRKMDAYKDMKRIYESVLDVLDPAVL